MKVCPLCKIDKADEEFNWRNKAKGWLRPECRVCQKARDKAVRDADPKASNEASAARKRKWRAAHPDAGKLWYASHLDQERDRSQKRFADPEYKAASLKRLRTWTERDPARSRAVKRAWVNRNAEAIKEYFSQYARRNRPKFAEKSRRRRALKLERCPQDFTLEQLDARMSVFGHRCAYCSGPFEEVDHVIALARGGLHCLANLRPACRSCNRRKSAKPIKAWLAA